jgi:hypothetical protein
MSEYAAQDMQFVLRELALGLRSVDPALDPHMRRLLAAFQSGGRPLFKTCFSEYSCVARSPDLDS